MRSPKPIALLGIPIEAGAETRGCVMGPAALRTAGLGAMLAELGYVVRDRGDLAAPAPSSAAEARSDDPRCRNLAAVAAWTRAIHDAAFALASEPGVPIFLGGDHSLSIGTVAGVARHCREAGRELAVLWIDAHADFNTPQSSPSGNMHGMPLAFLTGEPDLPLLPGETGIVVPARNVHLFGLRSIDGAEKRRVRDSGMGYTDMRAIDEFGVAAPMRKLIAQWRAGDTHLHVSLDVDVIDPTLAPGVGTRVPGGATYREAHLIMELLHESGLVGSVDVVELNPFLDEGGKSARLLVDLIASLFGRTVLERESDSGHPA